MKEIADLLFNYGVGLACVAYLIYFQNTTMKDMLMTLNGIKDRLIAIETKIDEIDEKK